MSDEGAVTTMEVAEAKALGDMQFQFLSQPVADNKLNYPGDRTEAVGQVLGPDRFGGLWRVTYARYDPQSDHTVCLVTPHVR